MRSGIASMAANNFFRNLQAQGENPQFDAKEFLLAVESQFKSPEVLEEVRWRLAVLKELTASLELEQASKGLRKALSGVFTAHTEEQKILEGLKELTEIEGGADGKPIDLRRFLKRGRRSYDAGEYAKILQKKILNTQGQVQNLVLFFPDSKQVLTELSRSLDSLVQRMHNASESITMIKEREDNVRKTGEFAHYERIKEEFLKKWLARFSNLSEAEVQNMTPEEVQRLIVEHQRHQMTQLLKTQIKLSAVDMTQHLDPHDTLESEFKDQNFWKGASSAARTGFRDWVLSAVQAFGMLKGHRFALFENEKDESQLLLFGIGVGGFSDDRDKFLKMVPFVKPFTRKGGYLLEIRKRELGEAKEYHTELRHYVLPFLFAFDGMKEFRIGSDLLTFFTSNY
jgi:hypothetical protein